MHISLRKHQDYMHYYINDIIIVCNSAPNLAYSSMFVDIVLKYCIKLCQNSFYIQFNLLLHRHNYICYYIKRTVIKYIDNLSVAVKNVIEYELEHEQNINST